MSMIICIFLLACSVFLSGCCPDSQLPREKAGDNEQCRMLQIEDFTVREKALTLDYQVTNPFAYDIWICEDIDIHGRYDVETRIDAETVWIKLRVNLESNIYTYAPVFAKHRRLSPGASHSGKILLNLPIRNASPVYNFRERRKKRKQIVLHRTVLEVGYFEGDLLNTLSERIEKGKRDSTNVLLYSEALTLEGIQHLHSHNTVCLHNGWGGIRLEKSAKAIVTDVNIPCSVVVDDE